MKKITTALSIASLSLLQHGCGGGNDSDNNSTSDPSNTVNTRAPELIAKWTTGCIGTITSTPVTSTGTSGGGQQGSARGDFSITEFTFNQDGSGQAEKDEFSSSDCNTNLRVSSSSADINYVVGNDVVSGNGTNAVEIDINYNGNISYTLFSLSNNTLFIADITNSATEGTSPSNRISNFSFTPYSRE